MLREETSGQRAFVDRSELQDHLAVYRPHTSTDHAGFTKRINASIAKMEKASVLRSTQVPDRFQISPVLSLVFGPDEVAAITAEYRRMLGEEYAGNLGEVTGTDSADDDGCSPHGDDSAAWAEEG